MKIDAISQLKRTKFEDVECDYRRKPFVIADGRVFHIHDLDASIETKAAYVLGVNQNSFDKLCRFLQPEILHFYEMRVGEIGALSNFAGLKQLAIRWNTKLVDLSPLSCLSKLEILVLEDTPKVVDLHPIADCTALSAVEYSGGIWNKNSATDLAPLAALPTLEDLVLTNLRVRQGGLRPLAGCKQLRRLQVSNQFQTEDYAFLSIALPNVDCAMFAPYVRLNQAINGNDIMIVGARKPFLSSQNDAKRIKKYEDAFSKLKAAFASDNSIEN